MQVAVLYARADSNYKTAPHTDVWDEARDARKWPGGAPVIAHPPCRLWGRLYKFAKGVPGEREMALQAVDAVRTNGGVLEHPFASKLWPAAGLPLPGAPADEFGGFTLEVDQFHWGHKARKRTWLYVCGCAPQDVPPMPHRDGEPTHTVRRGKGSTLKYITKPEREHTPPGLVAWLCDLARRCKPHEQS